VEAKVRFEHALLAVESEHDVHVMLELTAPALPPAEGRTPLRLAVALDRSGSMSGEKLETVKRCARFLVERLDPDDAVAVITFDDDVDLVASMSEPDMARLGPRIDAIGPGGMTNLSGGWLKAIEEAGRRADGVQRVLLLTDGLANVGIVDEVQLTSIARATAEHGIATTTIGVGDGFAEELLTDIADRGGGRGWFAESIDDVPRIFAEEFDSLVAVAAQNVSVEVRPGPAVKVLGILNDFPQTAVDGGVQVVVGDAFSGQRLRVVLKLHIPNLAALGLQTVAELVLRYVTVGEQVASHQQTIPLIVNAVSAEEAAACAADAEVTDEVVILSVARATDEARRLADSGDTDAAAQVLRESAEHLRRVAPRSDRADALLRQAEDLEYTVGEIATASYSAMSSKRLHYRAHEMKRDRRVDPPGEDRDG
jgi:Ca-activated chloride channel homolog